MGDKAGFDEDRLFDIASVCHDDLSVDPSTPPAGQIEFYFKNGLPFKKEASSLVTEIGDTKKIKVSSNDTTEDFIQSKFVQGLGISLSVQNDGANETFKIDTAGEIGKSRFAVMAGKTGNAGNNTYLEFFRAISSNDSPLVLAEDGTLKSLSLSVKSSTTVTVSIKLNGTIVETISLASAKTGTKSGLTQALVTGDELSMQVTSGSGQDVLLTLFMQTSL